MTNYDDYQKQLKLKYINFTKEEALNLVSHHGSNLDVIPEKYLDDKDIVMAAIKNEGNFGLCSERLQNDEEVRLLAIAFDSMEHMNHFHYIPDNLLNNRDFLLKCLSVNGWYFIHLPEHFKHDKEMALTAVIQGFSFNELPDYFKHDNEILIASLYRSPKDIKHLPPEFKNRKEMIVIALSQDGESLFSLSEEFQHNKELVIIALNKKTSIFKSLSKELQNDLDILITLKYQVQLNDKNTLKELWYINAMKFLDALLEYEYLEKSIPENANNTFRTPIKF